MGLEDTLRFLLLVAPYIPKLKYGLGGALQERGAFAPREMVQVFALVIGMEAEWVAHNVTIKEIIAALPVLDEVNDFQGLWEAAKALELIAQ